MQHASGPASVGYGSGMDVGVDLEPLTRALARDPFFEAAAVVGSRVSGAATEASDIDLFIYSNDAPRSDAITARRALAAAKFLEAHFNALFAANRVLHPGEKRLVRFVETECAARPKDLGDQADLMIAQAAGLAPAIATTADKMVTELERVVRETDYA